MPDDSAERVKAFPADWWKLPVVAETLAKCFAEHLVALEVAYLSDGRPAHAVFTGFLLRLALLDLWVTAGHVIETIRELLEHPRVRIIRAGLLDGYQQEGATTIPVPLADLPLFSTGAPLDFGTIALRKAYVAPIIGNPRFRPLTPVVWKNHDRAQAEGFYIVGMPAKWVEVREIGARPGEVLRKATMSIACIPVERIQPNSEAEPKDFWSHEGAFYGRLLPVAYDDGTPLDDIAGMSGGPVFSIERTDEGQFRYYLFGIQSAWLPASRIIRAAPIAQVADLIRRGMAYALDEGGERAETQP